MWHGEPGNCQNGAGFRPSRSASFREDAVRFLSVSTAQRAAKSCNDSWTGRVIEVEEGHGGAIVTRERICGACGERPEEDYVTGERHPILKRAPLSLRVKGRCARCFHEEKVAALRATGTPSVPA